MAMILRCGAEHRRTADIDLLDRFFDRDVGRCHGRFERVEIHDDEIDRGNRMRGRLAQVIRIVAVVEDRAENLRSERFHAPAEDLRCSRPRRDRRDRNACIREMTRGASGREDLDFVCNESSGQFNETALVGNRENRSADVAAHQKITVTVVRIPLTYWPPPVAGVANGFGGSLSRSVPLRIARAERTSPPTSFQT